MEKSAISWTDATVNFWVGCKKVSEGCKYCYMFREYGGRFGKDAKTVSRTNPKTFYAALGWKEPKKIFTCSWSDFFIEEADEMRVEAWDVIRRTPNHTWQILTKRPERILQCLPPDWGDGWPNVWIGISAENQQRADERLPILLDVPAAVRFVSAEPLLGPLDLRPYLETGKIHWVIMGGESGNETGKYLYRESEMVWFIELVFQCVNAGVAPFVKQLGTYIAKQRFLKSKHGSDILEFPPVIRYQLFPYVDYRGSVSRCNF